MRVTFYTDIVKGQIDKDGIYATTVHSPNYGLGKRYSFEVDIPNNVLYEPALELPKADNFKEIE